jgi:RND family efflux transporter MFP subunit
MIRRCDTVLIALLIILCGCNGPSEPTAPPSVLVRIVSAELRPLQETLTAYGTAEFADSAVTDLIVQHEARVSAIWVTSGEPVKKGQRLLELTASAASQLELDKARRDADLAHTELERVTRLRSQGLATQAELQAATDAAATAKELSYSLAQQVGSAGRLALYAPRDGIVDALKAQPGDLLAPGTAVARVAEPENLIVRLGIEPSDVPRLAPDHEVQITLMGSVAKPVAARLASIDRRVDAQTRLAAAIVRLPRDANLLPGSALKADIAVRTHESAVSVPRAAVLYESELPYVFVATGGVAHRRAIQVGIQTAAYVEVEQGLKAGEPVIVSGNYELEDGAAIRSGPDPHS